MVKPSSYRYGRKRPFARKYTRKYVGSVPKALATRVSNTGDDKYLRALINPFDSRAIGARIPDANACPSSAIQSVDTYVARSDATFNGNAYLFQPGLQAIGAVGSMSGTSTWTWPGGYATIGAAGINSNTITNFEAYRIVAHGIKITALQPVTAAQGTLHYCYGPMSTYSSSTWAGPVSISQMQKMNGYTRIPVSSLAQKSFILANKPLDVTNQRYIASDNSGFGNSGLSEFNIPFSWCTLFLMMESVSTSAATDILQIEMVQHLEAIVNSNNTSASFSSSDAQPYNPHALQVGAAVCEVEKVGMYEDDPQWDRLAAQAVDTIEGAVSGFTAGWSAGGPLGGAVGGALGTVYGGLRGFLGRSKTTAKRQFENAVSSTNKKKLYLKY